eukprot:Seg3453.3 transcript_id=Seg3453.3/GoldUCD/mRNA.D3Y31 product=5-oxoprolinase protein_id=Seg3453.3/GoldUCD/D3Y31
MQKMEEDSANGKFKFAIDRGGTFTDVYAECPGGKIRVMKLLSEDPAYPDAPTEAIRRILAEESGIAHPKGDQVETKNIEIIRMGTTVATNALLERKGARMALLITKGFKDLLHIGNQSRPNLFDLEILMPDVLFEEIVEVQERVVFKQQKCQLNKGQNTVIGTTKEELEIWEDLDETQLRKDLQMLLDKGIRNLAVVLMHAFSFDKHEKRIGEIAKKMGFEQVSLSSDVMPMVRIVPRGYTACADAYLTPCIKKYVQGFSGGFQRNLEGIRVLFMQSDGGLTPVDRFIGSRAILSGPAGGVVGYGLTTYDSEKKQAVIGFDMGGTSTDVSRYAGSYEHVFETTTAGVSIQAPQLDINTVAAGGGSRLFFRAGMFVVGPESAGAHPGPVCYRKNGYLAVTDANLILGRILPEHFPKIFGETKDQPLDRKAAFEEFEKLTKEVNEFRASQGDEASSVPLSVEEVAIGFIRVANEAMCRPIRALTQAKGYDTAKHILSCFGGAGGQHACSIAASLGMSQIFIHKYSGILSAYGIALADVVHEAQEPSADIYKEESFERIASRIDVLVKQCVEELTGQGFTRDQISCEPFLHMRYDRTDCALMCSAPNTKKPGGCKHGDFKAAFLERYKREFGFIIPDRPIIVDDIRVRATGKSGVQAEKEKPRATTPAIAETVTKCFFEDGFHDTSVYLMEGLTFGHVINGPAIIIDKNSTILVEPGCIANVTKTGDVSIQILSRKGQHVLGEKLDPIQLSIFSHRFMSTAEQMGRVLQRTSISTNIKERLDFSCAMFGPDGGLVANAPHIPVHLGAMQETVKYQIKTLGDDLRDGDVILSNHPSAGGSHLPDLTVITPVFYKKHSKPVFYVASRGHHADIGGITPGSMPPHSKSIFEEGAVFKSFKLVSKGIFQEEAVTQALMDPAKYPGSSGTRNLHDNISDLRAQVAANHKGIQLIQDLIDEYGLKVVQDYMGYIQENAELAVQQMLKEIASKTKARTGKTILSAVDYMDNGSPIKLKISINETKGTAIVDFTGTGHEVFGNINAPKAVTLSALIYCLRCMVGHDVPLNQGCLAPVRTIIPEGSLINPSETAAVVGGNVLTSQRIVDVIFKAFGTCAASQGCMNNITFGDEDMGYYETVAGGAGAGPTWHGRGGVHTHMTNTRITDPEILERRYPVVLRQFCLNRGTGGKGLYNGGDGIVREMLFRKPLTLSVLTERRAFRPYGLEGGLPGKRGRNFLLKSDGRTINLQGKTSVDIASGDCFRLESPGGGGYGKPDLSDLDHEDMELMNGASLGMKQNDEDEGRPSKRQKVELGQRHAFVERGSVHEYRRLQESV